MGEDSILKTIRRMLGPNADYDHFDQELMVHINTALSKVIDVVEGLPSGFMITGPEEKWSDFCQSESLSMIISFVYIDTKLQFDPPLNASVLESFTNQSKELLWRLECHGE